MRLTFLYCHFFFTFHVCVHSTHYIAHKDILKDKTKALNYKIIDISSSKIKAIKLASTKGTKVLLAAISANSICNTYYNESLERHRVFNSIWNIKLPWNPFFLKLTNYTPDPWVLLQFLFQHWWCLEQSTTNKEIPNLFFFCDDSILFWIVKLLLCFLTPFFWEG